MSAGSVRPEAAEELLLTRVRPGELYSLDDLGRLVHEVTELRLRETVWDLVDLGKLRLTRDWKIELQPQ